MLSLILPLLRRHLAFRRQSLSRRSRFPDVPFKLRPRLVLQHRHRPQTRLQLLHPFVLLPIRLKRQHRKITVNLRPRDLLQQLRPLIRLRLQKRRKLPLRQQHRPQKPLPIQPRQRLHHRIHLPTLVRQNLPSPHLRQRPLHRLQIPRLRLPQSPRRPQRLPPRLEIHLRKTLHRVPAHHLIRLLIPIPRRPPIQSQSHRIQQSRLPRPRRPRNEKHPHPAQRRHIKPHLMHPAQRVQILESDSKKTHKN